MKWSLCISIWHFHIFVGHQTYLSWHVDHCCSNTGSQYHKNSRTGSRICLSSNPISHFATSLFSVKPFLTIPNGSIWSGGDLCYLAKRGPEMPWSTELFSFGLSSKRGEATDPALQSWFTPGHEMLRETKTCFSALPNPLPDFAV